jgi:hypothetical protein
MNPLLVELERLLAQGEELAGATQLASAALQKWLSQRGELFAELDRSSAHLDGPARNALDSLLDRILLLDARIVAKAEAEMRRVSGEIASAQKLRSFLAGGVKSSPQPFLRRVL